MFFFARCLKKFNCAPALVVILFFSGGHTLFGQDSKPSVALLGVVQTVSLHPDAVSMMQEAMFEVLERTGRFELIDRAAVDEQVIKSSGASSGWDGQNATGLGKLLAAEKLVFAEIGKLGKTYLITVKLLDVSSGRIDHSETAEFKGKTKGLIQAVRDACEKIKVNDP